MDEYFCPNCGAILNNQTGFDPSLGSWRCTECGKLLMDDDVYDSDTFEGVAWFCDNCGALLNRQYGFSDSFGSWQCAECGHVNRIDESEIIDDDDDNGPKCPNCGSNLNRQSCYYDSFYDWTCEECGAKLHRKYYSDPYEEVEDDEDDGEEEDDEEDDDDGDGYVGEQHQAGGSGFVSDSPQQHKDSSLHPQPNQQNRERRRNNIAKRKKNARGIRTVLTVILIFGILFGIAYLIIPTIIPVRYDPSDLIGQDYHSVVSCLRGAGFTHVTTRSVQDLPAKNIDKEDTVDSIQIAWFEDFSSTSKYPSFIPIVVTYHELAKIQFPISSKEAKGKNYQTVQSQLQQEGFINVRVEVSYDLLTGWFIKENEIKEITINGSKRFEKGNYYRPDIEIVITYHALKRNQK